MYLEEPFFALHIDIKRYVLVKAYLEDTEHDGTR